MCMLAGNNGIWSPALPGCVGLGKLDISFPFGFNIPSNAGKKNNRTKNHKTPEISRAKSTETSSLKNTTD